MARVVILPVPAYGHVYPTLPLAQALLARGEDVSYCLPDQFMATITPSGAIFLPFRFSGRGFAWRPVSCEELFVSMPLHQAVLSLEVLPQLLAIVRAEQPDYLIYDASCLWGRLAARILHLPAIRFHTSLVLNAQLGPVFQALLEHAERVAMPRTAAGSAPGGDAPLTYRGAVEQLCTTYDLPPISLQSFFDHAEPLNLVPIPPVFQPGVDTFDARFQFLGPSVVPRHTPAAFPFAQLKPQPTLYIALGSVCTHEVEFFQTCFAAFGGTEATTPEAGQLPDTGQGETEPPWQVILATGTANVETLGPVPENFVVRPSVPQLEVLQQTSVFLTHGGMNSVMEALWYGVPLVVVPQMTEQTITAHRVEALGLGLALEKSAVTAASLQAAVRHVASDPEMQARVRQMQATMRQMGGARAAADAVIRFSRTEGQKGWSWPARRGGL
jgi:UDP:flavonoid glycosyltransferase YjiC (YdhE family)